jgi:hypothetical protein
MKLKESIKSKVDYLDPQDLRKVKLFIGSLTEKTNDNKEKVQYDPFL